MLSLKIHSDNGIFIHNTHDDTIGLIRVEETIKMYIELPQYMRIYRHQTLPPELRQRFIKTYPQVDFNFNF